MPPIQCDVSLLTGLAFWNYGSDCCESAFEVTNDNNGHINVFLKEPMSSCNLTQLVPPQSVNACIANENGARDAQNSDTFLLNSKKK